MKCFECTIIGKETDAIGSCSVCSKNLCQEHIDTCVVCRKNLCTEHIDECEGCGAHVCSNHIHTIYKIEFSDVGEWPSDEIDEIFCDNCSDSDNPC